MVLSCRQKVRLVELRRKETSLSDKIVLITEELQLTQSQGSRDSKKCLLRKLFDVKIRINNLERGGTIRRRQVKNFS